MIKALKTELFELHEININGTFKINLEIDYQNRIWTIWTNDLNRNFIFQNTSNYYAGIAIGSLIREATQIAKTRLNLTEEELKDNLHF